MTTGKTIALTTWTFVGKVMSLLCNMLSRLVIIFLPRSKCLLISWLQSPSAVILEPPKNKVSHCFHIYFPRSDGTRCQCAADVPAALEKAYAASKSGKIIAEQYIENDGELFSVRYLLRDGEAYPYFLMDTYVADPIHRTSLISAFSYAPSKYFDYYMEHMDQDVRRMLKGMGLKNGTAFIQSLPYRGKIYFHEMGYRLSGGMIFKLTEPLVGINDMQLMLRGAVGGEALTDGEIGRIDLRCGGRIGGQLMMPLSVGTIGRIEGLDEVKNHSAVVDFIQYYREGDTIEQRVIGTLGQQFCRITFIADTPAQVPELINHFQKLLNVYDTEGKKLNNLPFDVSRMEK